MYTGNLTIQRQLAEHKETIPSAKFEVQTKMLVKISILRDLLPCVLVYTHQSFTGACSLQPLGRPNVVINSNEQSPS
jgi:hypothetical protein